MNAWKEILDKHLVLKDSHYGKFLAGRNIPKSRAMIRYSLVYYVTDNNKRHDGKKPRFQELSDFKDELSVS